MLWVVTGQDPFSLPVILLNEKHIQRKRICACWMLLSEDDNICCLTNCVELRRDFVKFCAESIIFIYHCSSGHIMTNQEKKLINFDFEVCCIHTVILLILFRELCLKCRGMFCLLISLLYTPYYTVFRRKTSTFVFLHNS